VEGVVLGEDLGEAATPDLVCGSGFSVWCLVIRAEGLGFRVQDLGFGLLGLRVWVGLEFRIWVGLGVTSVIWFIWRSRCTMRVFLTSRSRITTHPCHAQEVSQRSARLPDHAQASDERVY